MASTKIQNLTTHTMLATDALGSIAEMPLGGATREQAETLARTWLATFDHGFDHAIVVDLATAGKVTAWDTLTIWEYVRAIVRGLPEEDLV